MAEALKTEEYNLSQLHLYQEMETSRKNKSKRKVSHYHLIQFLSCII